MKRLISFILCLMLLVPALSVAEEPEQEKRGVLSVFTASTLEGEGVDQSLLTQARLTMVNVWATYCSPCIQEMPDLARLAEDTKDLGVQIVGIVSDAAFPRGERMDTQIEAAKQIVLETGADYVHLLPENELLTLMFQINAVPTTFFVDAQGKQVGYAYLGSRSYDAWMEIIRDILSLLEE